MCAANLPTKEIIHSTGLKGLSLRHVNIDVLESVKGVNFFGNFSVEDSCHVKILYVRVFVAKTDIKMYY